jgi:DNA-binding GntR family transcriptional regulator
MSIPPGRRPTSNRWPQLKKVAGRAAHGSSSDLTAQAIVERVLSGRFVPGQRLTEGDLSRDLKVGRGTIREVLKRLAAERIIALVPFRGAVVRALTKAETLELQDIINALYGLAVSLAAGRIQQGDNRKRLSAAYQRLVADGPQSDRVHHAVDRSSFYDIIFSICGNRELMRINPAVLVQILRMQVHPFLTADDLNATFADYRPLYEALIHGDGLRAKRVFERHMRCRRKQLERLPDDAFANELNPGGDDEPHDRR